MPFLHPKALAKPGSNMQTSVRAPLLSWALLFNLAALSLVGCGASQNKKTDTPSKVDVDNDDEFHDDMEMMQEFGGMNEEKVTKVFKRLAPELAGCLTTQSETERYLAGDVAFLVKVDRDGNAVAAHAEKSNLGSYTAERCMLRILKASTWPKPVGGLIGLARWSIGFDAPLDERPPVHWTSDDAAESLNAAENASSLSNCGGGGPFDLTAYIAPSGKVLSVGVAHSDDNGEETAECLVNAVREMKFSSPGSWRAKVSFTR